jgi:hypothetical protein
LSLSAFRPPELHGYRIIVISFQDTNRNGFYGFRSISVYTPDADGSPLEAQEEGSGQRRWKGKDVFLILRNEHFTLIDPDYTSSSGWSAHPIDDIVAAISEFNRTQGAQVRIPLFENYVGVFHQRDEVVDDAVICLNSSDN